MDNDEVASIASVAHFLPERTVPSAEVERCVRDRVGTAVLPRGLIQLLSGVEDRRYADAGVPSSALAAEAASRAIEAAGETPGSIDLLVFAAASHDVAEPATANIVQQAVGCTNARVFDVKNACNSFLDALDIVRSLLMAGRAKTAVIATGEVLHDTIDWNIADRSELVSKFAALTLGDGGAACVVKLVPEEAATWRLLPGEFMSDGSCWASSAILGGGTRHGCDPDHQYFRSDSAVLHELALNHVPALIDRVLSEHAWKLDDIALIVPHQVSLPLVVRLCEQAGFPLERCQVTLNALGNMAAASIPIALSLAIEAGRVAAGDRVLLVGGAAGFSAAVVPVVV